MNGMKTIIAGSRDINDYELVVAAIEQSGFTITEVVSGKARGVDTLGEAWAKIHNIPVKPFPAEWRPKGKLDKAAGIKRNINMGNYADALIAVWDGKSRGTEHMIRIATVKGLKVFVLKVLES